MDDTTLLNLAGKAAGENYGPDNNPIERDDLALRLAVKLEIHIQPDGRHVWASTYSFHRTEEIGDDAYDSARRAIVRVAAEIGKAMP